MKFRPCIDIHNGKVKQIVGGSFGIRETGGREFRGRSGSRLFCGNV